MTQAVNCTLLDDALNTINQLPDNVDMEKVMYRLHALDKVRKGQEDVVQGRVTLAEDLISQW